MSDIPLATDQNAPTVVEPDALDTNPSELIDRDPFDPSLLRLAQNFGELAGVKKTLTVVPVRRPNKQDFVRVHPGADYRLSTAVLELKEENELYLVDQELWSELSSEIFPMLLVAATNRQGVLFLWPARLPREDGRSNAWNSSALEALETAKERWIRVVSNRSLGAYETYEAPNQGPDPEWPKLPLKEILRIAFKDKYIDRLDHAVVRQLQGR